MSKKWDGAAFLEMFYKPISCQRPSFFGNLWMWGWCSSVFGSLGQDKMLKNVYLVLSIWKCIYLTGARGGRHSSVRYCIILSALFGCGNVHVMLENKMRVFTELCKQL